MSSEREIRTEDTRAAAIAALYCALVRRDGTLLPLTPPATVGETLSDLWVEAATRQRNGGIGDNLLPFAHAASLSPAKLAKLLNPEHGTVFRDTLDALVDR